jgi:hypothetical protein
LEVIASPAPLEPPPNALPLPIPEPVIGPPRVKSQGSPEVLEVAVSVPEPAQGPKKSGRPVQKTNGILVTVLTLIQANILVAMLGGFEARRSDGHPGPKIMQRGLLALAAIVRDRRLRAERSADPPPPSRARKPG